MAEAEKTVRCPGCARQFAVPANADLSHLKCPHCEIEIPEEALKAEAQIAEELAPGFRPGQRFGNYVIESLLGVGGMAVVFKGRQLSLNRHVAIKILPKESVSKRLFVERFESEAAVLASLNHPNIVGVIDRGVEEGTYFIVMEYVEGETLKDVLQRETMISAERIFPIAAQVLAGLSYAHRRGVIHRDIKPGNIMINRDEIVKIADFGLAHLAKSQGGLDVTRENQAMGTLKYMAPEQLSDARGVDGRADLYSFGVCIYECLTGRLPLGMFKMPSEWDQSLDLRWDDVILRALKMEPSERFNNAEEMAEFIKEIATTPRMVAGQSADSDETFIEEAEEPKVASPTACVNCGSENPVDAHKCVACGASQEDLFDPCPKCGESRRMDVAKCSCGADLAAYRAELRKKVNAFQRDARRFMEDNQYAKAMEVLRQLIAIRTREFAGVRRSAEAWLDRVTRLKARHDQRVYEAGERLIAEGHADRGLDLWEELPDDYRDVGKRRQAVREAHDRALKALNDGDKAYAAGKVQEALTLWATAAQFFPHDQDLHKKIGQVKIELGNRRMRQGLVQDAKKAARHGRFQEAIALCHKALELDAKDASALSLLRQLEEHLQAPPEAAGKKKRKKKDLEIPIRPTESKPVITLTRAQKVKILLGGGLIVALALIFFVAIPVNRSNRNQKAADLYAQAKALADRGDEVKAIALAEEVVLEYPSSPSAKDAKEMSESLHALLVRGKTLCNAADAIADEGTFDSNKRAFREFERLLAQTEVAKTAEWRDYAKARLEELRTKVVDAYIKIATEDEAHGTWREALAAYKEAQEEFKPPEEKLGPRIARAEFRINSCAQHIQEGEAALKASQWNKAISEASIALDYIPTDQAATALMTEATSKTPPPDGMVFVPPGTYRIGGAAGNPPRAITLQVGFYLDKHEVSCGEYADFIHAAGWQAPPALEMPADIEKSEMDKLPMYGVTFADAAEYAKWAKKVLPTEEMYECAARGIEGRNYTWGTEWQVSNGVFGYGFAPCGAEIQDVSPCGATDLEGNVAEWTSTAMTATRQPVAGEKLRDFEEPAPQTFHAVKGCSWMGIEEDRPTRTITRTPTFEDTEAHLLLTPDPAHREKVILYQSDLEIKYVGQIAEEGVQLELFKWLPNYCAWAGARLSTTVGKDVAVQAFVPVAEGAGRRMDRVNFTTGCRVTGQEPGSWADIRDACGITRRLKKSPEVRITLVVPTEDRQPHVDFTLADSAAPAARMAGRDGARYYNVGFRCARLIWIPPAVGEIRRDNEAHQ